MSSYLNNSRMPEPRMYSHHDLFPGKWDPRCSPQFPLGNFWPVYVGNFWCDKYPEHATKVQEYFASKGLLVRMVFGRSEKDDPHLNYQRNHRLYDFLAYFVRQKDAEDAVNYCHREMYYGHRLNVFPGRTPVGFDLSKSVQHTFLHPEKFGLPEQVFEAHIHRISTARIECIVVHSRTNILVQYASVRDRDNALRKCKLCLPDQIFPAQAVQRFLEQDVMMELWQRIQMDPYFLSMLPPGNILNALFNGFIPVTDGSWRILNMLQMPNIQLASRRSKKGFERNEQIYERAMRLFGVECDFRGRYRPRKRAASKSS